ncbi:MAG: ferritin family protein [Nitrospiraceae bacterium]|nr:ferritin family protein [Nitrospiraceae bacterium]
MKVVELAMKTETDAIDFYAEAAQKTSNPVGQKMFLSIIEDERRHLEILKCIFSGMDIEPLEDTSPMRNIKTVFEENRELMLGRVAATTDETQALEIAMRMEKESVDFYEKAARQAADAREKTIYERLVKEEQEHYAIFSNTYQFLADSGNWFMWEEHSIVDGGTPWA